MWSQTFRQRVCVSRLYLFFLLRPRSRTCAPLLPFPFTTSFHRTSIFRLLVSGLSFLSPLSFVYSKGSNAFYPTVQLLTGTLRVMNAIARLNIRTKKGSKARRRRRARARSRPHDRRRRRRCLSFIPFWTRSDGDHGDRRSRETTAGCLKADIFLLHIINDRLARNVQ